MTWLSPEKREKFDYDLTAPLPGAPVARVSEATAEAEGAAFMALMALTDRKEPDGTGT